MKSVTAYLMEIKSELSRVTWPTRNEVVRLTLTVFLISAGIGLYVGGFDFLFTKLLTVLVAK
jgi:preprotein translocase subunit SecE